MSATTAAPGKKPRARTRRERIASLQDRLDYLVSKRDECKRDGRPYSYLSDEIEALRWAIPILEQIVAAAIEADPRR